MSGGVAYRPFPSPILKLDVGGKAFRITKGSLDRFPNSLLSDLVHSCPDALDREEPLFVDRNPEGFEIILDIYRTGGFNVGSMPKNYGLPHLSRDLDFYGLPCWQRLIRRADPAAVDLRCDAALNAAIDDIFRQIDRMRTGELLQGVDFTLTRSRISGQLFALKGIRWRRRANLVPQAWERFAALVKERGFNVWQIPMGGHSSAYKNTTGVPELRIMCRSTHISIY